MIMEFVNVTLIMKKDMVYMKVITKKMINIPANPRHYWRYRMHLTIEQLMKDDAFNNHLKDIISQSGR